MKFNVLIAFAFAAFGLCNMVHAADQIPPTPVQAPAPAPAPVFDVSQFQHFLDIVAGSGDAYFASDVEYRTLTHLDPVDESKPHKADYFADAGGTDTNGVYHTMEVDMESENWQKDKKGGWYVEQWIWKASPDGKLTQVNHQYLAEDSTGTVTDNGTLPCGQPTDDAEIERWQAKVTEWYQLKPTTPATN